MRDELLSDGLSYALGLIGVGIIAALTATRLPMLGLASSALLFLLPVVFVAARGGLLPALMTAAVAALAYNFFLLPPRLSLAVHGLDNVVSVFALFTVALVTSRLATALRGREDEAWMRAQANAQGAEFSAILGRGAEVEAIGNALAWLGAEYGEAHIVSHEGEADGGKVFSTLDLSAAAWAMHNSDITGHGTAVMPAADWTFLPISPRRQSGTDVLALARPQGGGMRSDDELARIQALARLLGQARDRIALQEERHARERLEDRDAFRRTLLASLAHDFRTPLTVVTGELAKLVGMGAGAVSALEQARRLDRMMDDLVGAARIESGALTAGIEAVDLVDVAADARGALALMPEGIACVVRVPADLPLVRADAVLLRHVLVNLIANAAQHARASIVVVAGVAGGCVELSVEDDGPGVPEAERERIFDRFTRVEGNDRRGGSGLGLAIVKGFADAMGMSVAVHESETGGARFRVEMPIWSTNHA